MHIFHPLGTRLIGVALAQVQVLGYLSDNAHKIELCKSNKLRGGMLTDNLPFTQKKKRRTGRLSLLLAYQDSNLDKQNQNLSYYHYTIGQYQNLFFQIGSAKIRVEAMHTKKNLKKVYPQTQYTASAYPIFASNAPIYLAE